MRALLQPGQFVRLPARPDWGIGQVQSASGDRVTVNFPHGGKVLLHAGHAEIEVVAEAFEPPPSDAPPSALPRG